MNHVSTKAIEGKTPFEAAFNKKPNLKDIREWGEKVLVRVEDGNKLGGRVREGRWIGVDEQSKGVRVRKGRWIGVDKQSKGVRVYWPDK
jgi:hypothetical protein